MNWPHPQYEPRIVYLTPSATWRCLVRQLPDGEYRSLEGPALPANPGHPDPSTAAQVAADRVSGLISARQEALAVEVVRMLAEGRLLPVNQGIMEGNGAVPSAAADPSAASSKNRATGADPGTDPGPGPIQWRAQLADGTWTAPHSNPTHAVKIALGRSD